MARSQMLSAVLQALTLDTVSIILLNYILTNLDSVASSFSDGTTSASGSANATKTGGATEMFDGSFLRHELPLQMIPMAVLMPLEYYWHIWLERMFPSRSNATRTTSKSVTNTQAIERSTAPGKAARPPLSRSNTFVQWLLHVTLGKIWIFTLAEMMAYAVRLKAISNMFANFHWMLLFNLVYSIFLPRSLGMIIAVVIAPADKRLIVMSAANLASMGIFGVFLYMVVPWLATMDFVRKAWQHFTDDSPSTAHTEL